jgi:hypothetical protein
MLALPLTIAYIGPNWKSYYRHSFNIDQLLFIGIAMLGYHTWIYEEMFSFKWENKYIKERIERKVSTKRLNCALFM